MKRRDFLYSTALLCTGALLPIAGCAIPTESREENVKPDVTFSNNDSTATLSGELRSAISAIELSAKDTRRVVVATAAGYIYVQPEGSKVKITKSTGDQAYIRFGTVKTSPSIILESVDGRIIQESSIVPSGIGSWTPEEWLGKAVLVLAGALTVWLGATIVKVVAAAIAYVAMNVLILSIIVAAAAIMVWLLERTGWSFDGLLELLRSGTLWIEELLHSIIKP